MLTNACDLMFTINSRPQVVGDSELLTRQMTGRYKVNSFTLLPLYRYAKSLANGFASCRFGHVLRNFNKRADELVRGKCCAIAAIALRWHKPLYSVPSASALDGVGRRCPWSLRTASYIPFHHALHAPFQYALHAPFVPPKGGLCRLPSLRCVLISIMFGLTISSLAPRAHFYHVRPYDLIFGLGQHGNGRPDWSEVRPLQHAACDHAFA